MVEAAPAQIILPIVFGIVASVITTLLVLYCCSCWFRKKEATDVIETIEKERKDMPDVHEAAGDKDVDELMKLGKDDGSFAASLEQQALLRHDPMAALDRQDT